MGYKNKPELMKTFLTSILLAGSLSSALAASTINPANHFAYGANSGWMDWRGDTNNGAVIGEFICFGYLYAANVGWISLGNGSPANGIRYQNNSAGDFGVNHDGLGNLHGFAYGANIGWITFTNRDATGATFAGPAVDLLTGQLSGHVYSANCGWIGLSNAQAFVQTDTMPAGADSDGDGIPDAWERLRFGNLTAANANSDADGDGLSDLQEYLADTDPLDANENLRISSHSHTGTYNILIWTARLTRVYRVEHRSAFAGGAPWQTVVDLSAVGLGSSAVGFDDFGAQYFYRVGAFRPLAP